MNSLRARRIEFARRAINHEDPCHLYRLALIAIQPWRDNSGEDQSEFKRIKNLLDRAYFKETVPTIIDATAQGNEVKSMIDEIMFGE